MRKIFLSLLLAGVAASPALAQDRGDGRGHRDQQQQQQGNRGDRGQAHQERQQAREADRQAPQQRFNGGGFAAQQQQRVAPQVEQRQQVQQWQGRENNGGQRFNRGDFAARQQAVQQQQQAFERGGRAGFDGRQRDQAQQWQGRNGYAGAYGGQARQWQQQGVRNEGGRTANNWNRNWRNNNRYDWRRYRNSHRSIFNLGIYFDPFGYGYQPFDIGYSLPPVYFGQQYWIDPAMYELPYPPPGAVWVRYWNDAVLVDTYSGQVIDVIHGFFW
jgi:Ni/Co efflux regulator RcnB